MLDKERLLIVMLTTIIGTDQVRTISMDISFTAYVHFSSDRIAFSIDTNITTGFEAKNGLRLCQDM